MMERQVASASPHRPRYGDIDVLNHIDHQSLWRPKTCRNGQRNAIDHEGLGFPRRLDAGGDQLVVGGLCVVADEGDAFDAVSLLGDVLLRLGEQRWCLELHQHVRAGAHEAKVVVVAATVAFL